MKCLKPFDVFISHAAEDKIEVADTIAKSLKEAGFRVWYSSNELFPGSSIIDIVQKGLRQSRCGIVVLSHDYTKSPWAIYELYTLMARRNRSGTTILPVWHNISSEEVKQLFPDIIDIFGLSTKKGLDVILEGLKSKIKDRNKICGFTSYLAWIIYKNKRFLRMCFFISIPLISLIATLSYLHSLYPPKAVIKEFIESNMQKRNLSFFKSSNCIDTSLNQLIRARETFDARQAHSNRHSFKFSNGTSQITSKVRIKQLGISIDEESVKNAYGFKNYSVCISENRNNHDELILNYEIINNEPEKYEMVSEDLRSKNEYHIVISHTNFIRSVNVSCSYSNGNSSKIERVSYFGFKPKEELVFENIGGKWYFTGSY